MITNHCAAMPVATNVLPSWDVRQLPTGPAGTRDGITIVLDHGYRLDISEGSAQIQIVNSNTDESTVIWGDPRGGWHGSRNGQGTDSTCFVLADNTRITISAASTADGAERRASSLVITRGEASMIVDGLASGGAGDLRIHQGRQGHALERLLSDGRTNVFENANGIGWQTGRCADAQALPTSANALRQQPFDVRAPTLGQQLAAMYHGCEPPRPPAYPADAAAAPPAAHVGKHGHGVHHGKHGYGIHHGKHGCGVFHGKHGYAAHHGKHGYGIHHGKHGHAVYHGKHGGPDHHGKHGHVVHHGKHRGRC